MAGCRAASGRPGRSADAWPSGGADADIRGYFGLYEVPYADLARLDYVERLDTWARGTFATGSLVDDFAARGIEAHVRLARAR